MVDCIHYILFETVERTSETFSFFFITQHSYLYVGRTLLENILARVRHPFRYPVGVRQNRKGDPRDKQLVFIISCLSRRSPFRFWRIPVGCLHARKGCVRLYSLFQTAERTNLTFSFFIYSTWYGVLLNFYNFKRFLACMIFLTTRSVLVFLPGKRSMAWIVLVSAFHLSCKFLARL